MPLSYLFLRWFQIHLALHTDWDSSFYNPINKLLELQLKSIIVRSKIDLVGGHYQNVIGNDQYTVGHLEMSVGVSVFMSSMRLSMASCHCKLYVLQIHSHPSQIIDHNSIMNLLFALRIWWFEMSYFTW